ncbi:xyloglucan galactosyltransferase KATAMARI1-like protein [Pyrus ussuriensis x Pyrus communis]|uniref:Xyloglucan galactosyltransferase KATAMARI1-like protein n=1 Tax=Pyrus ussuriensis x Pyrus communis TaxID=2448454 RepID=A0A5N5H9T1_9ROSA|nr:xyloglucan galactosyltransferase KATAMARI1-like protein [Pyrus ussuriensis x Pyrus communis]
MYSTSLGANNVFNLLVKKQVHLTSTMKINHTDDDSSLNRFIYIHDGLPARFNYDFLNNCESLSPGTTSSNKPSMCPHLVNLGLGPDLEVIFHNRMKKYECLTSNSTLASAICVPFYPSMDVGVHLWDSNVKIRDA